MRLTPNGIVHMGLLSTSPGARRRRDGTQQHRALLADSTMHSLEGTHRPAGGSDAVVQEPSQPRHAAGSPDAGEAARQRSAEELQEDRELLALRPTRDFVQGFNQHTSFHQRRTLRSAMEGEFPVSPWRAGMLCASRSSTLLCLLMQLPMERPSAHVVERAIPGCTSEISLKAHSRVLLQRGFS